MPRVRQDLRNGMNRTEREVLSNCPFLERIPSQQHPREIEIRVPVRLNPDFKLYYPPYNGIWVEVKGYVVSKTWFPALKSMPTWLKRRYKVVISEPSRTKREKFCKKLTDLGIDHTTSATIPEEWAMYALELYLNGSPDDSEGDLTTLGNHAKIVIEDYSTTLRQAEALGCGLTLKD